MRYDDRIEETIMNNIVNIFLLLKTTTCLSTMTEL
jgi:hypothetical protein